MKHLISVLLMVFCISIFSACQNDYALAPQADQISSAPVSLSKSMKNEKVNFSGTSMMHALEAGGTMKFLPNGKILGRDRISVYYDDVSDARVRGFSTWYIITARIEPTGYAKFNGKAELIVDENGGKWEMTWHGEMAPDGSIVDYVTGKGTEGSVKGMVAKWTYTRPAGMPNYYDIKGYFLNEE